MSGAVDRVRRILAALPEGLKAGGASLSAVAERLGVSAGQLATDLQAAMLAGRFPFSPDDLIEVEFEGDRFRVHLAQRLQRPPRLTAEEAWALRVALQLFTGEGPAPVVAADKVVRALGRIGAGRVAELAGRLRLEDGPDGTAAYRVLRQGLTEGRRVQLEYRAGGTGAVTRRRLAPYAVVGVRGAWYVVGHCSLRDDLRVLRVDRILHARLTGEDFETPADFDAEAYRAQLLATRVSAARARVRLRGRAAVVARERLSADAITELSDGEVEVSLEGGGLEWLTGWALDHGAEAEVLEPAVLRRKIVADLEAALARYR